jgi:tagatose-1,6-bisphosphate aldolase non-catalytic subunit AgaZ/GatZ
VVYTFVITQQNIISSFSQTAQILSTKANTERDLILESDSTEGTSTDSESELVDDTVEAMQWVLLYLSTSHDSCY